MIRRINLLGGPCSGKSTLAAWIFAELKMQGIEIEHVYESVKAWTFIGRPPQSFDQVYLFGKQLHMEDIVLRSNKNVSIVSESPILLSCCYAKNYGLPGWEHLIALSQEFEKKFPSLNFFINRGNCPYITNGRFQDFEASQTMDRIIKQTMLDYGVEFEEIPFNAHRELLEKCQQALDPKP